MDEGGGGGMVVFGAKPLTPTSDFTGFHFLVTFSMFTFSPDRSTEREKYKIKSGSGKLKQALFILTSHGAVLLISDFTQVSTRVCVWGF